MEVRSSKDAEPPSSPSSLDNASFRSVSMSPARDIPDRLELSREPSHTSDRSLPSPKPASPSASPSASPASRPVLDIGAIMASRAAGGPDDDDIDSPLERRISNTSDLSGTSDASAGAWGSSSAFANGSTTAAASALFGNRMNASAGAAASAMHKDDDGTRTPVATASTAAVPVPSSPARSATPGSPKSPAMSPLGPIAESMLAHESTRQSLLSQQERAQEADKEEIIASEEEKDELATMPDVKTPSKHRRNTSAASAASAVSSVSFEEVGFGDESPGWRDDPLYPASEYSRASSQFSSPAPRLYSGGGPPSASPTASERTIYGALANSTSSQKAALGLSNVGATVRDGDVDLVLGVAVVDFNHLVSCRCNRSN